MIELQLDKTLSSPRRRFNLTLSFKTDARRLLVYGPSGSGKTLLLQLLAGLQTPDAGLINIAGRTLFDASRGINLPARERQMGFVFQDYALFPHLNARQNIAFSLRRGVLNPRRTVSAPQVEQWLDVFPATSSICTRSYPAAASAHCSGPRADHPAAGIAAG